MPPLRSLLLSLALASPLAAQQPDRWQPVRDSIEQQLLRATGAAMAVAVARDGKIIWEQGFGWANRERRVRADEHTMFSLASISKPITATGLMVLAHRGRIDIDRPANDYLGAGKITGLAGDAAGATVRRVMSHSAGLPLHYQFFYANEKDRRPPSMDETIARYGNLVTAPGETFRYSNLGYGIVDYLIARTSGQSYGDFMRKEVFLPLGLTRTSVDIGPGLEPYVAERYDRHGRPVPFYTFDHPGGSAVYSSAHDLVRFGMFHLKAHFPDQRPILPDSVIDAMQRPLSPPMGDSTVRYGLGWVHHRSMYGYPQVSHTGGMPGVATVLNLFPTERIAIVALTNGGGNPFVIAEQIATVLLPRYADSLRAARARPRQPPAPVKFTPGAELAGTWEGTLRTWEKSLPMRMTIEADGDVKVRIGPEPKAGEPVPEDAQLESLLNNVTWRRPLLTGRFAGTIPTPDARWTPHSIGLELRLVGDTLRGEANAQTPDTPVFFSIASYVHLIRRR